MFALQRDQKALLYIHGALMPVVWRPYVSSDISPVLMLFTMLETYTYLLEMLKDLPRRSANHPFQVKSL